MQQLHRRLSFAKVKLTLDWYERGYIGKEEALAKACRKNYTLQNPDFCGSLVFRGFGG